MCGLSRHLIKQLAHYLMFPLIAIGITGCESSPNFFKDRPLQTNPCFPPINSLNSKAGKEWILQHRWRYKSDAEALEAYTILIKHSPIWPDWFVPTKTTLKPGIRFQMVLSEEQPADRPGDFGTFDNIETLQSARENLAIRSDWKKSLSKIVIYEVIKPLPVKIGPIAAQIDPNTCKLLNGKWSQIEFLIIPSERIFFMKPIEVRYF